MLQTEQLQARAESSRLAVIGGRGSLPGSRNPLKKFILLRRSWEPAGGGCLRTISLGLSHSLQTCCSHAFEELGGVEGEGDDDNDEFDDNTEVELAEGGAAEVESDKVGLGLDDKQLLTEADADSERLPDADSETVGVTDISLVTASCFPNVSTGLSTSGA